MGCTNNNSSLFFRIGLVNRKVSAGEKYGSPKPAEKVGKDF